MLTFASFVTFRLVIVDSTRRGKRFPDALSKTIPIWCAVLNCARAKLRNEIVDEDGKLWTLPTAVSRSEHAQIDAKVGEWAESLLVRLSYSACLFRSKASNVIYQLTLAVYKFRFHPTTSQHSRHSRSLCGQSSSLPRQPLLLLQYLKIFLTIPSSASLLQNSLRTSLHENMDSHTCKERGTITRRGVKD